MATEHPLNNVPAAEGFRTREDLEQFGSDLMAQGQREKSSLQSQFGAINQAARAGASAQRAGVAARQGKLNYDLKSGLRDIQIARRDAMRGVVGNALQRGIYNSGIRKQGQVEVEEGAINAEQDLRAAVKFGLQELQAQMAGIAAQLQQSIASNALAFGQQAMGIDRANRDFITQLLLNYGMILPSQADLVDQTKPTVQPNTGAVTSQPYLN